MGSLNRSTRFEWLDSLRGIAALSVAFYHIYEIAPLYFSNNSIIQQGSTLSFFIRDFFDFGKIGIVVFFFISGFVIPQSLFNKSLKSFAIGRFFRLYPAYWFAIFLSVVLLNVPTISDLIFNISMFQRFLGKQDLIGVFWTLQIELTFYGMCFLLHYFNLLFDKRIIIKVFFVLIFLTLLLAFIRYQFAIKMPVALGLGLLVMNLGFMLRMFLNNTTFSKNELFKFNLIFAVSLLAVCLLAYNKNYGYNETWYRYFASYLFGIALFYMFFKYKFSNKIFVYLGAISYSVYLLHPIVLEFIKSYWKSNYTLFTQSLIFYFLGVILLGSFSYFIIERPMVKIGKKLGEIWK